MHAPFFNIQHISSTDENITIIWLNNSMEDETTRGICLNAHNVIE